MITIKIDEEQALDMLMDRLEFWTNDYEVKELYRKMYDNYVYSGCFENGNFDVNQIVDNDYVNWCSIIEPEYECFNDLLKVYQEQGLGDISCEHIDGYSYIEAVNDEDEPTLFLVRS